MTFTELCADMAVTPDERMKLARHLATLRAEATLKLGLDVIDPRFAAAHYQDGRDLSAHGVTGRPEIVADLPGMARGAAMQHALTALEHAQAGLNWYGDRYPEAKDGSDDEAAELIAAAIEGLRVALAAGAAVDRCSRAAGHHFENGECVYCLAADPAFGVPEPATSSHAAAAHVGPPDWLRLAQECGGTVYRHRSDPKAPGVAFGDESWARFTAALTAVVAAGVGGSLKENGNG